MAGDKALPAEAAPVLVPLDDLDALYSRAMEGWDPEALTGPWHEQYEIPTRVEVSHLQECACGCELNPPRQPMVEIDVED